VGSGHSEGEPVWQAIFDLVKNISEVLLASLPNFWKISKNFMEGKYKKVRFGVVNTTIQRQRLFTAIVARK
jgi:hypothetical protein